VKLNSDGLNILKKCEGLYLRAYKDPANIWTIGYGTVIYSSGVKVAFGDTCTEEQAAEYLNYELEEKAAMLENWINNHKLLLSGNQFSALLCFAYNLGLQPILGKGNALNMAVISGQEKAIRSAFMLYTKITKTFLGIKYKKELPGLVTRRKLESDLYFKA
jgi:lysozyme